LGVNYPCAAEVFFVVRGFLIYSKMRICTKCKEQKSNDFFINGSLRCSNCRLEARKKYRQKNKEAIQKKAKIYREANKEKISEGKKKCYDAKKEEYLTHQKEYYQKNKEYITERNKKYVEENKEWSREYKTRWMREKRAKIKEVKELFKELPYN
jgi:hypothetical protein